MSTESARLTQSLTSFHPYPLSGMRPLPAKRRLGLYQAALRISDTAVLTASTYWVYQALLPFGGTFQFASLIVVVGIWLLLLHMGGFYNAGLLLPAHQLAYELVKTSGLGILAGSAAFYLIPAISVPRNIHWNAAILAGASLLLWRIIYMHAFPTPKKKKRAIFVGPTASGIQIAEEIQRKTDSSYEVIGFIENHDAGTSVSSRLLLGEDIDLPHIVRTYAINSIILPEIDNIPESTLKAIADCSELDCEFISTSRLYERVSGRIPVQHITHSWFVSELNTSNRSVYRVGKRLMDVSLAALGLFATGLLVPIIALLIKLDSPGPIFYSQIRVGKNGKPFKIYKFRTMVQEAERNGAVWAQVNDNRITKVGEFLRKTRLDELPQLYNVVLGEMSLVGPRPERPEFVEQLAKEIPFFNRRQMVLPGVTGWAQVNYPYGASTEDSLQKLQYDLYYIKNRSMFLDLEIILRTISVVINKTGAR